MDKVVEFLLYMQGPLPYVIAFIVLLMCGLGLPIPEDITLFAMGLISYYGLTSLKISIVVCLIGVLFGDCIIYFFGRHYGMKLIKKGIFKKLLSPERMALAQKKFHKMGNKVIFAARFMPGLRAPTYFSAGTLRLPFRVFLFYDGLAALFSVPLLVGVTYYFGDQVDYAIRVARQVQHSILLIILSVIVVLILKYFLLRKKNFS